MEITNFVDELLSIKRLNLLYALFASWLHWRELSDNVEELEVACDDGYVSSSVVSWHYCGLCYYYDCKCSECVLAIYNKHTCNCDRDWLMARNCLAGTRPMAAFKSAADHIVYTLEQVARLNFYLSGKHKKH